MDNRAKIEVNKVYIPFLESQKYYAILMGGAGSGKSIVAHQKILIRLTTESNHRFLAIRKVKTTIRSSVYQLFSDLIQFMGLNREFLINKTEMRFTHLLTGNEIICAGLDDPEKIKSIAGITGVLIEEATELEERDFNQLELRVRGETANYKQFTLCFNPIDENHWLKRRFFDKSDPDVYSLKTTFRDNVFLNEEYKRHLTERVSANENLYKIYVLGEWGRANPGGEFYKSFKFSKHVKEIEINTSLPIHVSFDFNVNPYITCTLWQLSNKSLYNVGEICNESPNNTTPHLCRTLISWLRTKGIMQNGLFIYGDASGKHKDTRSEKGYNDFDIIKNELAECKPTMRVADLNPPVVMRGNFINSVFESNFDGIEIVINNKSTNLIADLCNVKQASDGTKLKQKTKDSETGVSYEKYGHTSDTMDYLICEAYKSEFKFYQAGTKSHKIETYKQEVDISMAW